MKKKTFILCGILIACLGISALAADWPSQMTIGGFTVTNIRGTTNPDGSGKATGTLVIQGCPGQEIQLAKSPNGSVSGVVSFNENIGGVGIQALLNLSSSGLSGRGTVKIIPKPIADVSITVDSRGRFNGSGRLSLGRLNIDSRFNISSSSLSVEGSASVRDQQETALAIYTFQGNLQVQVERGRLGAKANGIVTRTGKLSNQTSQQIIRDEVVNINDGTMKVSVDGVSVTFRLF